MSYNGKYIRVIAEAQNERWRLMVFNFITLVGADITDEPLGIIQPGAFLLTEIDPFEFSVRAETVELSILQTLDVDFSLYNMVQNNDYDTTYVSNTKKGLYLEVENIGTGTKYWYKHRTDQISRTMNNNGSQEVKLVFYSGITEAENLKQWDAAGTSRNSAWTSIFQTGVSKTVRTYIESICSGCVDADFGSVSFSMRHYMEFVSSNSATVHYLDNIYIPGDHFLNGTGSGSAVHKTGMDVLKDLQLGFGMNINWSGLNKLSIYQACVAYSAEDVTIVNVSESITEEPLYFNLQGIVITLKDHSATPNYVHKSLGTVYYNDNIPVDEKNTTQKITSVYNDLTGLGMTPAIGMYADDPVGGGITLFKIVSVDGYTTNAEALVNRLYAYDAFDYVFRQRKTIGIKTPTFANSFIVNLSGAMEVSVNPGGLFPDAIGKAYKIKRGFSNFIDEFEMYTYTTSA